MPVKITAYLCQYHCGHKSVQKIDRMNTHERHCWKNPDNRTCATCKHDRRAATDYPDHETGYYPEYTQPYFCEIDAKEDNDFKCVYACKKWERKDK